MPGAPIVLMAPAGGPTPAGLVQSPVTKILTARTLEEMANLAFLLVDQPAPAGRHVAFVTNEPWASHAGVNRQLAGAGLLGPDLTQYAEHRSKVVARGTRMHGAVLSLAPDVSVDSLSRVLTTVTDERGVDAVVVAPSPGPHLRRGDVERVLGRLRRSHPNVVVVAVDEGEGRTAPWRSRVVPVFDSDSQALAALAGVIHT
jgi:acyl-CoA synthetase (NDP forming)